MRSLDTLFFGSEASSVILAFMVVIPHLCQVSPRWFTPLAVNLAPGVGRGGRQPQIAARRLCVRGGILAEFLRNSCVRWTAALTENLQFISVLMPTQQVAIG
jgi:hypothetical protein